MQDMKKDEKFFCMSTPPEGGGIGFWHMGQLGPSPRRERGRVVPGCS